MTTDHDKILRVSSPTTRRIACFFMEKVTFCSDVFSARIQDHSVLRTTFDAHRCVLSNETILGLFHFTDSYKYAISFEGIFGQVFVILIDQNTEKRYFTQLSLPSLGSPWLKVSVVKNSQVQPLFLSSKSKCTEKC